MSDSTFCQLKVLLYNSVSTVHVCSVLILQIQEGSPHFFPVLKARCFKQADDETNIRLTRMEDNVQKILDRFVNEVSCEPQ